MSKRPAVIFDMDGTLADVSAIRHYVAQAPKDFDKFHAESVNCPPHEWVAESARNLSRAGYDILVVTARKHRWRHQTAWWLGMHNIPSDALFMRADGDQRKDVEVKRDILASIREVWDVVYAYDDNPAIIALWRSEGIPVTVVPGWEH